MRDKMVTRTIINTKVTALALNAEETGLEEKTYIVAGSFDDSEKLLKALRKSTEDTVVKVISAEGDETRYGMKESDFIKAAVEMPALKKTEIEVK